MPKIIFITGCHLLSKENGAPAPPQAPKKYLKEGWEVFVVSDNPLKNWDPALAEDHDIKVPPSFFSRFRQARKIGALFRHLDHRAATKAMIAAARKVMGGDAENTILYAYEVEGVEACRRLSKETGAPLVTRFQGASALLHIPNTWLQRFLKYPHFQAYFTKADLIIMTDDGTFGAQVLSELGNDSPTLFLRNGLELMEQDLSAMKAAFPRADFRRNLGVGEEDTLFLTLSRLHKSKRVDRAIDGFADFCRRGLRGRLVIAGYGDDRPNLERRVNELGIADRVVFTGKVPHDGVYDYFMACDVFMTFDDFSVAGNPLFEAMTLGKCVVALDVGDTRLLQNRENSILLKRETLPSLGSVLVELAGDPALRERLGTAAAAYAQEHFYTWAQRMDIEFQAVSKLLKEYAL